MKRNYYRLAITVRLLGPTDTQGYRYKAFCEAGSITVPRDYSLENNEQAAHVARALILKLGWENHGNSWEGGSLKNGDIVFVCQTLDSGITF